MHLPLGGTAAVVLIVHCLYGRNRHPLGAEGIKVAPTIADPVVELTERVRGLVEERRKLRRNFKQVGEIPNAIRETSLGLKDPDMSLILEGSSPKRKQATRALLVKVPHTKATYELQRPPEKKSPKETRHQHRRRISTQLTTSTITTTLPPTETTTLGPTYTTTLPPFRYTKDSISKRINLVVEAVSALQLSMQNVFDKLDGRLEELVKNVQTRLSQMEARIQDNDLRRNNSDQEIARLQDSLDRSVSDARKSFNSKLEEYFNRTSERVDDRLNAGDKLISHTKEKLETHFNEYLNSTEKISIALKDYDSKLNITRRQVAGIISKFLHGHTNVDDDIVKPLELQLEDVNRQLNLTRNELEAQIKSSNGSLAKLHESHEMQTNGINRLERIVRIMEKLVLDARHRLKVVEQKGDGDGKTKLARLMHTDKIGFEVPAVNSINVSGCKCSWAKATLACSSYAPKVVTAHCRKVCCKVSKSNKRYRAALASANDIPNLHGYMGPVETPLDKIMRTGESLVHNDDFVKAAVNTVAGFLKGGKGIANLVQTVRHKKNSTEPLQKRIQALEDEVKILKNNAAHYKTGNNHNEKTEGLEAQDNNRIEKIEGLAQDKNREEKIEELEAQDYIPTTRLDDTSNVMWKARKKLPSKV